MAEHLGKPLTRIPDPFGDHRASAITTMRGSEPSSTPSASTTSSSRPPNATRAAASTRRCSRCCEHYDAIRDVILPTLGPERRATYSPFLPISPVTGQVLQVPIIDARSGRGTIFYKEPETGKLTQVPVTERPLQAAMEGRLGHALGSARRRLRDGGQGPDELGALSADICRILGAQPPEGFNYELFLDEKGEKISKSNGNGLTIEEWLAYAAPESLGLYMYQSPRKAKRLYFDVIPAPSTSMSRISLPIPKEEQDARLDEPGVAHPLRRAAEGRASCRFALLLNLASASNSRPRTFSGASSAGTRRTPRQRPHPLLDRLVGYAIRYFDDFVKPDEALPRARCAGARGDARPRCTARQAADSVLARGDSGRGLRRRQGAWVRAAARVVLRALRGAARPDQGPRFGSFVELYGIPETRALIANALK